MTETSGKFKIVIENVAAKDFFMKNIEVVDIGFTDWVIITKTIKKFSHFCMKMKINFFQTKYSIAPKCFKRCVFFIKNKSLNK